MISSNVLLAALTFLSISMVTATSGPYQSLQDYINDIPYCINNCWSETWSYAADACPGNNFTCVCLIPEPDTTDPILAKEFQGIDNCTSACSAADKQQFAAAQLKFDDSCQPYYAKYGHPVSESASYYLTLLTTATGTVTYPGPNATQTVVPLSTASASITGNKTLTIAPAATGTSTASVAVATTNAAVWKGAEWEMSFGLPVLVSFVLGVGAQLF